MKRPAPGLENMPMTEHNPLPVQGYTAQPYTKVNDVNENKQIEERLLRRLEALSVGIYVDGRWMAIAKTHFEQGFMALNRAIFKPTRIKLPEDGGR